MRLVRLALVTAGAAVTGAFFFSAWAINAERFGRHDMGWALFFVSVNVVTLYASLALAAAALSVGVAGLARRRPSRLDLAALALTLLPIGYLSVRG